MVGTSCRSQWLPMHIRLRLLLVALLITSSVALGSRPTSAAPAPYRVDLKVLLLDNNTPWVDAIEWQMLVEGVPYESVPLAGPRPEITPEFLATGDRAHFQAVVAPSYVLGELTDSERAALRAYEAKFGVREVAAFNYANPAIGLNVPTVVGDISGTTANVTAAGLANGFGYLDGPVPFGPGSYSFVAEPLAPADMPAGASYSTLLGYPLPNGATGSLIGVYSNAGVEQMTITAAFSFTQSQFKLLAHGIVSWMTRGVHFGYNRNNFTFHFDDGFADTALWDPTYNCTPGEDCPRNPDGTSIYPETSIRMTPEDVAFGAQWQQANGYQLTIAFNAAYADEATDPLTQSFQANKAAFRWLNHGFEHIFQGCVQNFTVVPWQCAVDSNGQIVWTPQDAIYNEIHANIVKGQALGLPFDPAEYLSGEHSGLFRMPQQPIDNPNFAAALTQAGVSFIGGDASREGGARQVGSATTIPRHPTALYYNTATAAQAVDEYNWLYNSRANGGSGYCEDNPATATCILPLGSDGFTSYIVPSDAAFNLGFILSNDPRPFYAHTSNLAGERLAYLLLDAILGKYRAAFTTATPLLNLTLTEASTALRRQNTWSSSGVGSVTGYVQNGQVTIENPAGVEVPFTAPTGTVVNGGLLQPYGGESSGWLAPGSTTATLPASLLDVTGSTTFVVGQAGTINITATGTPAPSISVAGSLPTGLVFTAGVGSAAISGTPTVSTAGVYPLTITSVSGSSTQTQQVTITVTTRPAFTSATTATALTGVPFSFVVATTGSPSAAITRSGSLPTGITFTANAGGTATFVGTATTAMAGRSFPVTLTATNSAGATTQSFTITVGRLPAFTSTASTSPRVARAFTFTVRTVGSPTSTLSMTGTLPTGVRFTTATNGTATLSGRPGAGTAGTYTLVFRATNIHGMATQTFTLRVSP